MNITVSFKIDKDSFTNFAELEAFSYNLVLATGREFIKKTLEVKDLDILAS